MGALKIQYNSQTNLRVVYKATQNGTVVEETNYDPWGRVRDPQTWQYDNTAGLTLIYRGYTGHEHLSPFGGTEGGFTLINMNGRMYDPVLGRMLSPDNYVQSPSNPQNYNRYAYVLNNPLKFVDPSGEFMAALVFTTTFFSQWAENSLNGVENPAENAYIFASEVTNNIDNAFMWTVYSNDNINVSAGISLLSAGPAIKVSYKASEDLTIYGALGAGVLSGYYANIGASYRIGDFTLSAGAGYSKGGVNMFSSETIPGGSRYYVGATYYDRPNNQYWTIGYTMYGGNNSQNNWYVGWEQEGWHVGMTNDAYVGSDKWRTAAVEGGYGQATVGFNLITTPSPEDEYSDYKVGSDEKYSSPIYGDRSKRKKQKYTYSQGERISAALYLGYGGSRIGVDAPWVQDVFQNGIHYLFNYPYFNTTKGAPSSVYLYNGYQYPYSLYGY